MARGLAVVRRVYAPAPRVCRVQPRGAKQRAQLPHVGGDDGLGPELAAGNRREHTSDAAVFEEHAIAQDRAADDPHRAARADRRSERTIRNRDGLLCGQSRGDRAERELQPIERRGQMAGAEMLKALAYEQARPEYRARHLSQFFPVHPGRERRADQAPGARARDDGRADAHFRERLYHAYVREPADRAAAEGEPHAARA